MVDPGFLADERMGEEWEENDTLELAAIRHLYQDLSCMADRLLTRATCNTIYAGLLLSVVLRPTRIRAVLLLLSAQIEWAFPALSQERHDALLSLLVARGSERIIRERARTFGWKEEHTEEMRDLLVAGLQDLLRVQQLRRAMEAKSKQFALLEQSQERLLSFMRKYQDLLKRQQGPFPGCVHCPGKCFFRAEVSALLTAKDEQWVMNELLSAEHHSSEERYHSVVKAGQTIVQSWLLEEINTRPGIGIPAVAYCVVLHAASHATMTLYEQVVVGEKLKPTLLGG
ncbi:MAG: hypothetical protein J2P37_35740 [Ktedonobacteraceae bacterium]|nr:hypothetical protein [Ktedonobacteraceae bacterium]